MLILVGVTVTVAINGGLFEKAKEGKEGTRAEGIITKRDLWKVDEIAYNYAKGEKAQTLSEVLDELYQQSLITAEEKTTIENTGKITVEELLLLMRQMEMNLSGYQLKEI